MDIHALEQELKSTGLIELCLGTNDKGEDTFIYINVPLDRYAAFKEAVLSGEEFETSDFGDIIAEGKGAPPPTLVEELKKKYGFWDSFEETMNDVGQSLLDEHARGALK